MKLKTVQKKIRRLERRLREGPEKLAKLKRKLEALEAAKAERARRKSAAGARPRQLTKPLTPMEKELPGEIAGATKPSAVNKPKRKLNLSPERRAQLAAAMKARWAAKRAAAATSASTDQGFTQAGIPQTRDGGHDNV